MDGPLIRRKIIDMDQYIDCPVGLVLSPSYCAIPPITIRPAVTCSTSLVVSPAYCDSVQVSDVPLPAAGMLYGSALMVMAWLMKRRRGSVMA